MPSKYLASYEKLASSNGYPDPMHYAFGRLKQLVKEGKHDAALRLSLELIPYGHGKKANVQIDAKVKTESTLVVKRGKSDKKHGGS